MTDKIEMKKLLIILCETPFHSDKVDQTIKIAEAAISKKHEVSVFLFMDGVYNMTSTQDGAPFKIQSVSQRLQDLINKGAAVYCCKLCTILRGITEDIAPSNIQATGVAELNDLIAEADAVISFMG
jgi:sulfur relay (sulfurtransferase) complex TusBCD TusD component (DsrE family)